MDYSHGRAGSVWQIHRLKQVVRRCRGELTTLRRRLARERARRVALERALRTTGLHYRKSLAQSHCLQEQLRHLSHRVLSVQEEERKRLSRELHDQIVQILTGIHLRLANLRVEATNHVRGLDRRITHTQRLVEKSVAVVHRVARDLSPRMLDDLGLIPAIHSFMKDFAKPAGLRIDFTTCPASALHDLSSAKRTVLYRVAQEALTNVARHARAEQVKVTLEKVGGAIRMEISDDGKGFAVERVWSSKPDKRLGLLGMRERVQMVGGEFAIHSALHEGTTVRAEIPIAQRPVLRLAPPGTLGG